jgi:exosome complex component CSL4
MMTGEKPVVLPGDKVAVSEEFLPGSHVYDDEGSLRALAIGKVRKDQKGSEIDVEPVTHAKAITNGDYVIGQVEVAQSSSAGVRIYYLNGEPTTKGFSGSLTFRSGPSARRGQRNSPPVKLGDVVRARVFSTMNGMIHLSINEENLGVVSALCGNCGRSLLRAGNRLKCDECGNVEERKLANDFGQTSLRP